MPEGTFPSRSYKFRTACGPMFLHVMYKDDSMREIINLLVDMGKNGTCAKAHIHAEVALLAGIFRHCPREMRDKILLRACGIQCGSGGLSETCIEIILRKLLELNIELFTEEERENG